MGTFALDLAKFADKVEGRADDVVGDVVVQLAAAVDRRSPVGDPSLWKDLDSYDGFSDDFKEVIKAGREGYAGGRFRANWQLGLGAAPAGVLDKIDPDGTETQGHILASIPDEAAGKLYYLVNNLPYAQKLEEGHSTQAPSGMVGLTVIEFPQMVEQAVAGLLA